MSAKLKLTVKDFLTRGGSVGLPITSALISQQTLGSARVPKLIITRKADLYSSRFAMFANLRRTNKNYRNLEFPQLTLTLEKYAADGKLVSATDTDFFNVVVEDTKTRGTEEEITFLADRKSFDFTISNVEVFFD
jgi:hypothetical protein